MPCRRQPKPDLFQSGHGSDNPYVEPNFSFLLFYNKSIHQLSQHLLTGSISACFPQLLFWENRMDSKFLALAFFALLVPASSKADIYCEVADVDRADMGVVWTSTFTLGRVFSVDSVSLDIAHTFANDLDIVIVAPDGTSMTLMSSEVDQGGSSNLDLGLDAADSSLSNAANYTFVETGGATVWNDSTGVAPSGTYNSNIAGNGSPWITTPQLAGDWRITVRDTSAGDRASIGKFTFEYTPGAVPEPHGAAVLIGLLSAIALRRRRQI